MGDSQSGIPPRGSNRNPVAGRVPFVQLSLARSHPVTGIGQDPNAESGLRPSIGSSFVRRSSRSCSPASSRGHAGKSRHSPPSQSTPWRLSQFRIPPGGGMFGAGALDFSPGWFQQRHEVSGGHFCQLFARLMLAYQ